MYRCDRDSSNDNRQDVGVRSVVVNVREIRKTGRYYDYSGSYLQVHPILDSGFFLP